VDKLSMAIVFLLSFGIRSLPLILVLVLNLLQSHNVSSVTIVEQGDGYNVTFGYGERHGGATNPFYCGGNVVDWKVGKFNSSFHAILKVEAAGTGADFSQYRVESTIVDRGIAGGTIRNTTDGPYEVGQLFDDSNDTGYYLIDERFVYETTGTFDRSWSVRVTSVGGDSEDGATIEKELFAVGGADQVLIERDYCIDEYKETASPSSSPTPSMDESRAAYFKNGITCSAIGFLAFSSFLLRH